MSPTALRVDPKIVDRDAQFHTESQLAETAFEQMEDEEIESMHARFVKAMGGKLPTGDIVATKKGLERIQKESTTEQTKNYSSKKCR